MEHGRYIPCPGKEEEGKLASKTPLPFSNKELSEQKVDELQAVKDFTVRLPFYYADKSRRIQEV